MFVYVFFATNLWLSATYFPIAFLLALADVLGNGGIGGWCYCCLLVFDGGVVGLFCCWFVLLLVGVGVRFVGVVRWLVVFVGWWCCSLVFLLVGVVGLLMLVLVLVTFVGFVVSVVVGIGLGVGGLGIDGCVLNVGGLGVGGVVFSVGGGVLGVADVVFGIDGGVLNVGGVGVGVLYVAGVFFGVGGGVVFGVVDYCCC